MARVTATIEGALEDNHEVTFITSTEPGQPSFEVLVDGQRVEFFNDTMGTITAHLRALITQAASVLYRQDDLENVIHFGSHITE